MLLLASLGATKHGILLSNRLAAPQQKATPKSCCSASFSLLLLKGVQRHLLSYCSLVCSHNFFFCIFLAVVWRVWPEIAGWNCDTVVLWRQNCCGFCFCLRAEAFCVFRPLVCPSVRPPVLHILAPLKRTPIENPFYWHKYLLGHKLIRIRRSVVKTFLSVYWEISTQTADFTDLGFHRASAWRGSLQQHLV